MDNSRRPRTRGGDGRRRGVRVRGARTALAHMGIGVVGVACTSKPPGSGSRGGRRDRALLQGPNRLKIHDINEMPVGEGLETPLHVYRKRRWQPSVTAAQPPSTSHTPIDVVVASVTTEIKKEPLSPTMSVPSPAVSVTAAQPPSRSPTLIDVVVASVTTEIKEEPLSPTMSVPSPAVSVTTALPPSTSPTVVVVASVTSEIQEPLSPEMSVSSSAAFTVYESSPEQIPRPSPRQRLSNRKINYGSEPGSDDSGDEEMVAPLIPRTYRSILETPMDTDIDPVEGPSGVQDGPSNIEQLSSILEDVPTSATERPWSIYDFEWSAFPNPPIPPQSRREIFSNNNVGPTIPCVDPYEIFVAIWDREFMEYIVAETNRYAQQVVTQMLSNNDLHPNSRISHWYDTTVDELYVYFALIIGMGVVVKTRLEEYWSSSPDLFYTPGFSAHMTINRFILLNKCLHFNNNDDMCALNLDASGAKLFKIQPVVDHCNLKFNSLYNLSRNISLDESLLQWKGLLDINQLIPHKAATVGIKTYEICESQTGYLWRFEIHTHKKSSPQQTEDKLKASTPATVLRLIHGLENRGHTLWMDNYYNSPILARRLKSLGFDCAGTLRSNRLYVPEVLHNLTKINMRPNEIAGLTSGDIDTMVWRDNNRVAMISTYHGNSVQLVRGSTKPILILDYNIMMGGVDKKDQMLAMYPIERKRTKIWYKKLFRRLLNVSILNSYIIHKHNSSPHLSHRNFRTKLVTSILSKHRPLSIIQPATPHNKIDISHRIEEYLFVNRQRQRRVCIVCKKRVSTFCVGCNKTLCIDPCFVTHHT